jgi:DNA-binding response OmpR family regulator
LHKIIKKNFVYSVNCLASALSESGTKLEPSEFKLLKVLMLARGAHLSNKFIKDKNNMYVEMFDKFYGTRSHGVIFLH